MSSVSITTSSHASPWWSVPEVLATFAAAGVLDRAEVHLAATLVRLAGIASDDPDHDAHALAVALAARAPRFGHVGVDLAEASRTIAAESSDADADGDAVTALPWPDATTWLDRVAAGPLVAPPDGTAAPLVVHAGLVYLDRYRTDERVVAHGIAGRAAAVGHAASGPADVGVAADLLRGDGAERQLAAVASSLDRRLTVLVGGPGTGKTTTVAALVASLVERAGTADAGHVPISIALAAPTGKAAARLGEAFREAAARLPERVATGLGEVGATTIHRLLGSGSRSASGSRSRFRHHGGRPLPHDVVIVDEASMISLPLMARLLDAVRPDARLVVVGDPGQLASVEAGAVLGDIVAAAAPGTPLAGCVTVLEHSRRFPPGSPIARLAEAVRSGDPDAVIAVLSAAPDDADTATAGLRWIAEPVGSDAAQAVVHARVVPAALEAVRSAQSGDAEGALAALARVRVLCAHRTGPSGIERWNRRIESWLEAPADRWYPGRPVLVTANDHRNRLYNGDLGVVVAHEGRRTVAFDDVGGARLIGPSRLEAVETTHAMTIHKSQGSEFDHVVVLLPAADSRLATRELLYTAITRARSSVTVVGEPDAVRAAVERRTERASRLRHDLLGDPSISSTT